MFGFFKKKKFRSSLQQKVGEHQGVTIFLEKEFEGNEEVSRCYLTKDPYIAGSIDHVKSTLDRMLDEKISFGKFEVEGFFKSYVDEITVLDENGREWDLHRELTNRFEERRVRVVVQDLGPGRKELKE